MDCITRHNNDDDDNDANTNKQWSTEAEVLPITKLRFSSQQLHILNYQLIQKIQANDLNNELDEPLKQAESIVERLTQRLISAVGNLDTRFACKFLISLNDLENWKFGQQRQRLTTLKYLIRLDALSTPTLYPNDMKASCEIIEYDSESSCPGYAKIRLRNKTATDWSQFINTSGFLRRDKIQERFVELLALAASGNWPTTPLDVDESFLCAAPGKVLDAATLHHILHRKPDECLFYGTASNNVRFPDPRDFRLAIIDEPSGVRLRVGFLSPSFTGRDVEVRLLLAINVDAWPYTSDFPARVSLDNADALLYHRASQTGMYLVASGAQISPFTWQIQLPAAELTLLNHYGPKSPVQVVLKILYATLNEIHSCMGVEKKSKYNIHKLLSRRLLRETLWHELESDDTNPLTAMVNWMARNSTKHVLQILDQLIGRLRQQVLNSYFFPKCNLFAIHASQACEDDYLVEANRLHMYLAKLHDESMTKSKLDDEGFEVMRQFEEMDAILVRKWCDVVNGLTPPIGTRSSRFSSLAAGKTRRNDAAHAQYTNRQLEYIGLLLKSVLNVKQITMQATNGLPEQFNHFPPPDDPIEDVIYLLVTIIEQARDHSTKTRSKSKYNTKIRTRFDMATAKLVEAVRKERKTETFHFDYTDDNTLVKTVLKWLYKGLDQSKQNLGPILRPYLNRLFQTSHELSWHLETMRHRDASNEMYALGIFCRLVNAGQISPAAGLIESVNKGWNWAKDMLGLVERSTLRVVFVPERGKVHRHILSLPSYDDKSIYCGSRSVTNTLKERKVINDDQGGKNSSTLPARSFYTFFKNTSTKTSNIIPHNELRESSPMTSTLQLTHRYGNHRCAGDLIQSMVALHKISILQEISNHLPPNERQEMLDIIQKHSRENKRQTNQRRRNLPSSTHQKSSKKFPPQQKYTSTLAPMDRSKQQKKDNKITLNEDDSLIGSCRAARICEDGRMVLPEHFQIKSLIRQ